MSEYTESDRLDLFARYLSYRYPYSAQFIIELGRSGKFPQNLLSSGFAEHDIGQALIYADNKIKGIACNAYPDR